MKNAQIIPTLDRSGAEKQLLLLARELTARGHVVQVAALTRLGPLENDFRQAQIPVHLIGKSLKVDPFALKRLANWLRQNQFDVVQSWLFAANSYTRAAARLAYGRNRTSPAVIATEMAVDFWKSKWHFKIDRKLSPYCDAVVGNSQAVVDFYRDTVGLPQSKLFCIHSGIEAAEAKPVDPLSRNQARLALGLAPDHSPVILFAGRLAPQKKVDSLLRAIDIVRHLYPNIRLLIAGDGPLKSELITYAKGLALENHALFLGLRSDMNTLYGAADIVALPSSYEGLPNVVMEAQLRLIPVVASAAPGTIELVENHKTGLTFPVDDSTELARVIHDLLTNQPLSQQIAQNARQNILTNFSVSLMTDRFESLYADLLQAKNH